MPIATSWPLMRQMYEKLTSASPTDLFQILGIPAILFLIGIIAKILINAPFIQSGTPDERNRAIIDIFQMGLEFCLMSMGIYWSAFYQIKAFETTSGLIFLVISFICLLLCVAVRNFLYRCPWGNVIAANMIGWSSLALSALTLLVLERPVVSFLAKLLKVGG